MMMSREGAQQQETIVDRRRRLVVEGRIRLSFERGCSYRADEDEEEEEAAGEAEIFLAFCTLHGKCFVTDFLHLRLPVVLCCVSTSAFRVEVGMVEGGCCVWSMMN